MQPIALHADHLHHLTAAGDEFCQVPAIGVSQGAWFRPDAFGEQGVDLGVERIGLSQAPDGTDKVPRSDAD